MKIEVGENLRWFPCGYYCRDSNRLLGMRGALVMKLDDFLNDWYIPVMLGLIIFTVWNLS